MKHPAFVFGAVVMTRVLVDVSRETVAFGQDALCGCDWLMVGGNSFALPKRELRLRSGSPLRRRDV